MTESTPKRVRFSHHTFKEGECDSRVEFIDAETASPIDEPSPGDVGDAAMRLREFDVREVVLVHGTFAGNDIIGLTREIGRLAPGVGGQLSDFGKKWFDEMVGEVGNYVKSYEDCLSQLINPPSLPEIAVRRFHWSGENHHLGRANGAISLLKSMFDAPRRGGRVLMLAHSHGGNLIAMLSQIIGADVATRRAFFDATKMHYRSPVLRKVDLQTWQEIRQHVVDGDVFELPPVDVATFGTPLRYRWNTKITPNLLHFVQHRKVLSASPAKAAFPGSVKDVFNAAGGDYVQHVGIAGTDFLPSIFAWRDWVVERRMRMMFEWDVRRRDLLKNLRLGRRASCEGTTLLVDYHDGEASRNRKLLGHGVYTCRAWLPFHLNEIVSRFYNH